MAFIDTARSLVRSVRSFISSTSPAVSPSSSTTATTVTPLAPRASATSPYESASTARRAYDWNTTRIGQNTLLWNSHDILVSRSRDMIRNNPWAGSAIDKFEANVIGTGIQPHFQHKSVRVRDKLQKCWDQWIEKADYCGQNDFYTMQSVMAREVFEAGEVFLRHHVRAPKDARADKLVVPYQVELIESEQLPIFINIIPSMSTGNTVRLGIEFDGSKRRLAYHFYAEHPGESALFPADSLRFVTIPAGQISHVYRPIRAQQLRGEPRMTSVLTLLYELDQYADAALVKKKISAMLAIALTKPVQEDNLLPPDPNHPTGNVQENWQSNPSTGGYPDPGTAITKLESGTIQELLPGEDIKAISAPTEADFAPFMTVQLHKLAAGMGLTYEQLTGDLTDVNFSSIRSGMLEFRRACEAFQYSVIVNQGCKPMLRHWMDEAMLTGALDLPGYFKDPTPYLAVDWVPPGWDWVDPKNDIDAAQAEVRNGFKSKSRVIRSKGYDPASVSAEIAEERKRDRELGLIFDSSSNDILIGRETQPTIEVDPTVDQQAVDEGDGADPVGTGPSKKVSPAVKPGSSPGAPASPSSPLPKRGVPVPLPSAKPKPGAKPDSSSGSGGSSGAIQ